MLQEPRRARRGRRRWIAAALAIATLSAVAAYQILDRPTPPPAAARQSQLPPAAEPPSTPRSRLDVEFGRAVRLEGVSLDGQVVRPGEYLRVWLHWQAIDAPREDLRSLGRLIGPNGRVVGKEDDQIGPRRHQLSRWRPGDRQVDEMRIRIPPSATPGEYELVLGVLRPDNQTSVPIVSPTDRTTVWGEDGVLVAAIEVRAF